MNVAKSFSNRSMQISSGITIDATALYALSAPDRQDGMGEGAQTSQVRVAYNPTHKGGPGERNERVTLGSQER